MATIITMGAQEVPTVNFFTQNFATIQWTFFSVIRCTATIITLLVHLDQISGIAHKITTKSVIPNTKITQMVT